MACQTVTGQCVAMYFAYILVEVLLLCLCEKMQSKNVKPAKSCCSQKTSTLLGTSRKYMEKDNTRGFIQLFIFMKNEHLEQYYLGESQTPRTPFWMNRAHRWSLICWQNTCINNENWVILPADFSPISSGRALEPSQGLEYISEVADILLQHNQEFR